MRFFLSALVTVTTVLAQGRTETPAALEVKAAELCRRGNYVEAERLQRKALRGWEELAKEGRIDLAKPNVNLAQIYVAADKLAAAERHAQVARELQEQKGAAAIERVAVQTLLARIQFARGDYAQAAGLQAGVVRMLELPGAGSWDTLAVAWNDLGMIRAAMGDLPEARSLLERSVRLMSGGAALGEALGNLALVCARSGDKAAAAPYYAQAIDNMEVYLGTDHPHLGLLLSEYAELLKKSGRKAEATAAQIRARAIRPAFRSSPATIDLRDLQAVVKAR